VSAQADLAERLHRAVDEVVGKFCGPKFSVETMLVGSTRVFRTADEARQALLYEVIDWLDQLAFEKAQDELVGDELVEFVRVFYRVMDWEGGSCRFAIDDDRWVAVTEIREGEEDA